MIFTSTHWRHSSVSEVKHPLLGSAVLLAGATAFLYSASTAYIGGYLGMLKLDADVLDRNFHQVLYSGMLVAFGPISWMLCTAFLLCGFYTSVVFGLLRPYLKRGVTEKRRILAIKHLFASRSRGSRAEQDMKRRARAVFACLLLLGAFLLTLAHLERKGRRSAQEMLQRLGQGQAQVSQMVRVKIEDQPRTLAHLMCGARNCAGLEVSTGTVFYYPQTGHSFQYFQTSAIRR
ncbi:hypothetical protein ACFPPF_09875 [Xenophilus aerolatus]|nr:hypothetical protein [Xenophilus aerolatus]